MELPRAGPRLLAERREDPRQTGGLDRARDPRQSRALHALRHRWRGELDGFEPGTPGRYGLHQDLLELAFQYRGFSFQNEWHRKEVTDHETDLVTRLEGAYVQMGFFPWAISQKVPRPLELAVRWAFVDPNRSISRDNRRELTFAANWFFSGHDNKVTADFSRLDLEQAEAPTLGDHRFRLQWDISF